MMNEDVARSRCDDDVPLLTIEPSDKPWVPYRYKLMALAFFGFFNASAMRINFNIAMEAMVNYTATDNISISDECPGSGNFDNASSASPGEFNWNSETQGQLLGAFFFGYIFTQFPGGYLAELFGAKYVLGLTVLLSGLLALLIPVVARLNVPEALIVLRILMGIAQGPIYPSNHALWGKWSPAYERSQLTTWSGIGALFGMVVSQSLTGWLCDQAFLGGWPSTFYIFGGLSILWFVLWYFVAHDCPEKHPGLSNYERWYIETNNTAAKKNQFKVLKRPWKAIFTSMPYWAILVFSLMDGIGYYILFSGIPIYMKQILKFDLSQDGILSSLPYLGMLITGILAGPLADWMRRKEITTTTQTRKLFAFLGETLIAVFLVGIAFVECDQTLAVVMVILAITINGLQCVSQPVNHLDIAPIYAGTLMGISNILSNIGGFVSPVLVTWITKGEASRTAWRHVFYLAAGLYTFGSVFYIIFSSGEEQPWAKFCDDNKLDDAKDEEDSEEGRTSPHPSAINS